MKNILVGIVFLLSGYLYGQTSPNNGVAESKPSFYALKNATIYVSPTEKIQNGTLLIKGDKIFKVGAIVSVPNEAVIIDCKGKTIFPAFIELNSDLGIPKVTNDANSTRRPQLESNKAGDFYWNESVHPEIDAAQLYKRDAKQIEAFIEKGFGYVLSHQQDGIFRGKSVLVNLNSDDGITLNQSKSSSFYSLHKGVSKQTYPSSQMGSIALFKQVLHDASWYASNKDKRNLSLEALNQQKNNIHFFQTEEKWEILRAQKLADEFGMTFNYIGSGNEYQIVNELKKLKSNIILPLNFPSAYDVKNPYVSRQIPLSELKHWELAPMNPGILNKNGVSICLSSSETKTSKDFWENLRSAISHGLSKEQALHALTLNPAKIIGMDSLIGTLEKGKLASFIVYDGNPLEKECKLLESWMLGDQTIYEIPNTNKIQGKYNISVGEDKFPIEISGANDKLKGKVTYSKTVKGVAIDTTVNANVDLTNNDINIQFIVNNDSYNGNLSLRGKVRTKFGVFEGDAFLPNGELVKWTAVKSGSVDKEKVKKTIPVMDSTNRTWFPNMAYGYDSIPTAQSIVIKNATLWTNESEGIVKDGSIVIENGKITFVGHGNYRTPNGARVIDAKGKHVTSGIIDEHSHIAVYRGVNESGQAISAEVSIGDVIYPDDINIYRQLSGGVTASQILHGSANPIGGQSGIIKLKWGSSPEQMLIDKAPKFIKFALGENVKQSNWGDSQTTRFPQTRMGVEQLFYDGFYRAKAYEKEWNEFKAGSITSKPRKDLELEVLGEILRSERFISCHSYVQSEINMLMHVADSMGFKVNTFTHILEGYKVADKMKEHGAGGSTFSDWWAYKFEVNDAIPYNAAIMHSQGIVTAINSDDAEMGRRLNQEAAKGVKYGGMKPEDAWKMVTLNPAKLLHLDDRMGSLKVGKDADVVIWSDNPLSIKAKVENTIIDGTIYFDQNRDIAQRKKNQAEKARIITKMLEDNKKGKPKKSFFKKSNRLYHCDSIGEEMNENETHAH